MASGIVTVMASLSEMQTIKITYKALLSLRLISMKTGEKQYAIMQRVLAQDAARLLEEPILYDAIHVTPEACLPVAV